jgi:hypothetical protein
MLRVRKTGGCMMKMKTLLLILLISSTSFAQERKAVEIDSLNIKDYSVDCVEVTVCAEVHNPNYSLCKYISGNRVLIYAQKTNTNKYHDPPFLQISVVSQVTFKIKKGHSFKIVDGEMGVPVSIRKQQLKLQSAILLKKLLDEEDDFELTSRLIKLINKLEKE